MMRREPSHPVCLASVASPLGEIWLAADRIGAVAIGLRETEAAFRARFAFREASLDDSREAGVRLACLKDWLRVYLNGSSPDPRDVPRHMIGTPFQCRVWEELARLPYGELVTYGELARRVDGRGARAVGQAVGQNPLPILVPCHRVVAAGGALGGFSGGLDLKRHLLAHEGFRVDPARDRIQKRGF